MDVHLAESIGQSLGIIMVFVSIFLGILTFGMALKFLWWLGKKLVKG